MEQVKAIFPEFIFQVGKKFYRWGAKDIETDPEQLAHVTATAMFQQQLRRRWHELAVFLK